MPRGPRDDAPGVAHHVMLRGIERRRIFRDDADRIELLRRLSRLVPELGFRCFAWVLMPNHLHLVLRSENVRISQLMARLATGYAGYFNRRHDRVGHLFQNRFRSRRVVDEADLMGLVLYVSRNPLEAGLVANARGLEGFPWCGLGGLLDQRPPHAFESVREALALFDPDPMRARGRVRGWIRTEWPLEASGSRSSAHAAVPAPTLREAAPRDFDALLHEACAEFGVTPDQLRSRRRAAPLLAARSALVVRSIRQGTSGAEIARRLGMTRAGVSWLLARNLTT